MDARLQRRVQRYGWDLAAADYEALWQRQLAPAQAALLDALALRAGEEVLDVACGTGLASFAAADAVGPQGRVLGVDISGHMVEEAAGGSGGRRQVHFARMDAEALALPAASFDVALCALGLMYLPDPLRGVREMLRVLRPGGRLGLAVWGERERCGWAPVFGIVDAEVQSDVCPLFFALGQGAALAELCATAGLTDIRQQRLAAVLGYRDGAEACAAAFIGGPVALAWSRFDAAARARAHERYLAAIGSWRRGTRYELPGEFVVVSASVPAA